MRRFASPPRRTVRSLAGDAVTMCLALSGALAPTAARAEGLAQVGVGQDLEDDTVMYVDILSA